MRRYTCVSTQRNDMFVVVVGLSSTMLYDTFGLVMSGSKRRQSQEFKNTRSIAATELRLARRRGYTITKESFND